MEKQNKINKDINVNCVPKLSFGGGWMLNILKNRAGLNYGLKKVIVYANYVRCQAIVNSSFNKLKTSGLIDCLMKSQIAHSINA